jgi:hypothetical protein
MKNRKTFRSMDDNADHLPQVPYLGQGFFPSVNDLDAAELPEKSALLTGLQAGDIGLLFSDTALSQSNFLLQLAVSLAAGDAFPSLLPSSQAPRRVLYLNPTWRLSRFRQQLNPLFNHLPDAAIARKHLQLSVEPQHTGRPLNLNLDTHYLHLKLTLKVLQPEIIIVDDLLALFPDFADEETGFNARHLLYRLQGIAEGCKCVLLAGYVLPRGGGNRRVMTSLTRVADAVFRLEKPRRAASPAYLFRCEKSKGELAKAVWLEWQEEDWRFLESDEQPSLTPKKLPTVNEIVAFVEAEHGAKTGEIIRQFADCASPRKMAYLLNDAKLLGRLYKAETGYWLLGDGIEEIGGKSKQAELSKEVFGMEGLEGSEGLRHLLEWEQERQQEEGKRGRGDGENGAGQAAATNGYVCAESRADVRAVVGAEPYAVVRAD